MQELRIPILKMIVGLHRVSRSGMTSTCIQQMILHALHMRLHLVE